MTPLKRYFLFVGILTAIIILILPCMNFVETYFHERAHQQAMAKENISSHLEFYPQNFFSLKQGGFTMGKAVFDTPEDKQKFLDLPRERRYPILIAGVMSDLAFALGIVLYLLFWTAAPFLIDAPKFKKWYDHKGKYIFLIITAILLVWLMSIIYSMMFNMTSPNADIVLAGVL